MALPSPLTLHRSVDLRAPVLVAAFAGWNDAGDAATWAVRHLQKRWSASLVASIDGEQFTDFSVTRPLVELDGDNRRIVWPRTELRAATAPASPLDVVFVTAVEPQLQWRTYTEAVLGAAAHLGVGQVVLLGALLGDTPHTREVTVYGSTEDAAIAERLGLEPSTYEGPTGIVGVLHDACRTAGVPSVSLWASVPSYLPGVSSPKAALALVRRLGEVLEVAIPLDTLPDAAQDYETQLDALVGEDAETAAYVAELESAYDQEHALPDNAAGLVEELERFLREQGE